MQRRLHGGGVFGLGADYPSTIESSFDGSPPHELRSQGGAAYSNSTMT